MVETSYKRFGDMGFRFFNCEEIHGRRKGDNPDDIPLFTMSMSCIGRFTPVFDHCDTNYEVEDMLRDAGVILPSNRTDTESALLWMTFSSVDSALNFQCRLNTYLVTQLERIEVAYPAALEQCGIYNEYV